MSAHPYYCTLSRAKQELKATTDADDAILLTYIADISARIDDLMTPRRRRPVFTPYVETRQVAVTRRTVDSVANTLRLRRAAPLLAIATVTVNSTTITADVDPFPPDASPISTLRYDSLCGSWYDAYNSLTVYEPAYAVIAGVWGFHRDYASAWDAVTTLGADVASSATTVTVASGAALSPGHLLQINDEYLTVTAVNGSTVTVVRGMNGTTAAAHTSGDTVQTWQMERPIARVVARQVGMMYARRGAYEIRESDGVGGTTAYPQDLLTELRNVLTAYQYA